MARYLSQRGLEAFRAVMTTGSISTAAEMLHVSQPAVSRLIKDLEDRTGLTLFTRMGGRIVPTVEAREFEGEVERAFIGLSEIARAADEILQGQRGTITVASMPALAQSILPDTLTRLHSERPDLRIELVSMRTQNVVRQVASRQASIGFTSAAQAETDVELISTGGFPYRCIMPDDHRLAGRDAIELEELAGQAFIGFTDTTVTGRMLDKHFSRMHIPPQIVARAHLSALISALVIRRMGVGVVDPFMASEHEARGGVSRPLLIDDQFTYAAIKPFGQVIGQDVAALLKAFEEIAKGFDH